MGYIAPNTNIKLLGNVPLAPTYGDTIYFDSASAQQSYFAGKTIYNLVNQSYQRQGSGRIKAQIPANIAYKINYLMFNNAPFENKWFYAFITNVEYVNNNTFYIDYEIDVIQTWFFDFNVEQCFVEREHSATDEVGDNIIPENLNTGEMVCTTYGALFDNQGINAVVLLIVDSDSVASGTLLNGIFSGCKMFAYNDQDIESIQNKISEYAQSTDSIVAMYMAPLWLFGTIPTGGVEVLTSSSGATYNVTKPAIEGDEAFSGYTPKNKKLYTYPFNYYQVDNGSGQTMKLRYEFFSGLQPNLYIGGSYITPVSLICKPVNYKGVSGVSMEQALMTEYITLDGFPTCSWNTDYFAAWAAQNSVPILLNAAGNIATGAAAGFAVGGAAGALAGSGSGILSQVTSLMSEGYTAAIHADIYKGNLNAGNINTALKTQRFNGGRFHVTAEYARMIDDYFTMFGYATKRVKTPNRKVRKAFTYTKTVDCVIVGTLPGSDAKKICQIHDNGLRYWVNGDTLGDYSVDNSPL